MKTKQDAIREAYGDHWDAVKNSVDEDGWFYNYSISNELSSAWNKLYENCIIGHNRIRPKSLCDLEYNNGWTRIESEADLPKEEGQYFVYDERDGFIQLYTGNLKNAVHIVYGTPLYSHYQPIIKPQPPIY